MRVLLVNDAPEFGDLKGKVGEGKLLKTYTQAIKAKLPSAQVHYELVRDPRREDLTKEGAAAKCHKIHRDAAHTRILTAAELCDVVVPLSDKVQPFFVDKTTTDKTKSGHVFRVGDETLGVFSPMKKHLKDPLNQPFFQDCINSVVAILSGTRPQLECKRIVDSAGFQEYFRNIKAGSPVAFDVETYGEIWDGRIVCASLYHPSAGSAWFSPEVFPLFRTYWNFYKWIAHNSKYDVGWMMYWAGFPRPVRDMNAICTWMGCRLMDEIYPSNLNRQVINRFNGFPYWVDIHYSEFNNPALLGQIAEYCCYDTYYTYRLWQTLVEEMDDPRKECWKETNETVLTLRDIEEEGLFTNQDILKAEYRKHLDIVEETGKRLEARFPGVNFASHQQVKDVVFKQHKFTPTSYTKTGAPQVSAEALLSIPEEKPDWLLDIATYRKNLQKITGIYDPYLRASARDEKIHTNFWFTDTNRLTSSDPNLQNIDRDGAERTAFVSRFGDKGCLIQFDYKAHEWRATAHLSGDPVMIADLLDGKDPHMTTANAIGSDRHTAKNVNFSVIMDITAKGLAKRYGFNPDDAKTYIKEWFKLYKKVKVFHKDTVAFLEQNGYTTGPFGRRRHLPRVWSKAPYEKGKAKRQGINHRIQNAVECAHRAMNDFWWWLQGKESRLVGQIHDSLIVDCYLPEQDEILHNARPIMCDVVKWKVPLAISAKVGYNLLEGQEFDL